MQNILPRPFCHFFPNEWCNRTCDSSFGYLAERIVADQTQCIPYHGTLYLTGLSPRARLPLTLQNIRAKSVRLHFQPCSGQTIEILADCIFCDICATQFCTETSFVLPVTSPVGCSSLRNGTLRLGVSFAICQAEFCGCDKMQVHLEIAVRWIMTLGPCAIIENQACAIKKLPLYPNPVPQQRHSCSQAKHHR